MDELISVIVPVFNVEMYLSKCITSILDQTYKNIEVILVNDGSTDDSGSICDQYAKKDNRIKVIHKKNNGVSHARNIGIDKSNGKWITFVDSDDWIEDNYLEMLLKEAKSQDVDIVLCGHNKVWENNIEKINQMADSRIYNSREYLIKTLNPQTGFGFCHMKLIKRECINEIRFNENLVVCEDALFNMQISKNIEKAYFCSDRLYNYRNNSNSVVKKYDENYENKYLKAIKIIKQHLINDFGENEILQNYYNFVAFHLMLVVVNYCYHPKNKTHNKRKLLKEVCNNKEFKEGIKKSNYENLSLTRKITLFTIKHKLYILTEFICRYRQMQNKGEKK